MQEALWKVKTSYITMFTGEQMNVPWSTAKGRPRGTQCHQNGSNLINATHHQKRRKSLALIWPMYWALYKVKLRAQSRALCRVTQVSSACPGVSPTCCKARLSLLRSPLGQREDGHWFVETESSPCTRLVSLVKSSPIFILLIITRNATKSNNIDVMTTCLYQFQMLINCSSAGAHKILNPSYLHFYLI